MKRKRRKRWKKRIMIVIAAGIFGGSGYYFVQGTEAKTPQKEERGWASRALPEINKMLPEKVTVTSILQNPELPTGCEATAGTMLLEAYGYKVEKTDLAGRLNKGELEKVGGILYGPHPDTAFIGDPASNSGYGTFPGALAEAMNQMIAEQGGSHRAKPLYGKTQGEILEMVNAGIPVCVWSSMDDREIEYRRGWYLIENGEYTDEYFSWPRGEHVLVVTGCDEKEVFVCDPQKGECSYPRESFFRHYEQVGSYALILEKVLKNKIS